MKMFDEMIVKKNNPQQLLFHNSNRIIVNVWFPRVDGIKCAVMEMAKIIKARSSVQITILLIAILDTLPYKRQIYMQAGSLLIAVKVGVFSKSLIEKKVISLMIAIQKLSLLN